MVLLNKIKIISSVLATGLNVSCGDLKFDDPIDFEDMLLDCAENYNSKVGSEFLRFVESEAYGFSRMTSSCTIRGAVMEQCPDLYSAASLLYVEDLRWVPSWNTIIGYHCSLNDSRCIIDNVAASLGALMDYCNSDRYCALNNEQLLISEHRANYDGNLCFAIAGYTWE